MQLPSDAIIEPQKLTNYLLVLQPKDDKSKYLKKGGYTLENWQQLEADIRSQILTQPAHFLEKTNYGKKYMIVGTLNGRNSIAIKVKTIWMITGNITKFVTLVPMPLSQQGELP
jgi:hypothetical protein